MELSVLEEKIVRSSLKLKTALPYYSIVYTCMEKQCREDIETMGVSEDTLVYNPNFVESISVEELNFVSMHEIIHVALKHVSRAKGKDKFLWNMAADMIANKFIVDELQGLHGTIVEGGTGEYGRGEFGPGKTIEVKNARFRFLEGAVYCASVDLEVDSVESIYNELMRQANSNGYTKAKNKIGGENESDEEKNKLFKFSYRGSSKYNTHTYEFNVRAIEVYTPGFGNSDLMTDSSSKEESEQRADKFLNRVAVKNKLSGGGTSFGHSSSHLELEVGKELESKFDWRKFVIKHCIKITSKDSSFRRPDKRMMYQRAIYPGQMGDENLMLKDIKVCIDTSGSISNTDLRFFMGQLKTLLEQFKVEAEVIYWDGEVEHTENFNDYKELRRVKAYGGGGTDVSCVFEYLKSKKCKVKPALTIIFTDGEFAKNFGTPENKRKFKDTLWVISQNGDQNFKPDFGKVGYPEYPAYAEN